MGTGDIQVTEYYRGRNKQTKNGALLVPTWKELGSPDESQKQNQTKTRTVPCQADGKGGNSIMFADVYQRNILERKETKKKNSVVG